MKSNLFHHGIRLFIMCYRRICLLTSENSHSTMNCIRTATCQGLHQNIEQFRPRFRPVPVSNGRHCICNTNTYTSNGFSESNRQQTTYINFCLQNHNLMNQRTMFNYTIFLLITVSTDERHKELFLHSTTTIYLTHKRH